MTSTGSSVTSPAPDFPAGTADVLIGVPAYNMGRTIDGALAAVRDVVLGPLGDLRVAVVVTDGGSTDGTADRAAAMLGGLEGVRLLTYPVHAGDELSLPFHGLPARGRALATLFGVAHACGAKAAVIVDAGGAGCTADGVARLVHAVLDEAFDYAAAVYLRAPHAGALTKCIVAPLFRACYGARFRQPMGGEFACSAPLVAHCLEPDVAVDTADPVGVNLRIAIAAASGGFRPCEVIEAGRSGVSREDGLDLSTTLAQVVGALFVELERTAPVWHRVRRSVALPVSGPRPESPGAEPPAVQPLIDAFRLGYRELRELWSEILPPSSILALKRLAVVPDEEFRVDATIWARIVYDFALGHRLRVLPRDQLLRSLTPLYLGWLASFILQIRNEPVGGIEAPLERVSLAFEAEKPHLISGWRWPERFAPLRPRP